MYIGMKNYLVYNIFDYRFLIMFYSGNNTYCMHSPPDYVYHGRCMHHNYRIPIPVIPVRYSQLPGNNIIR